jgi:hypothetical protein
MRVAVFMVIVALAPALANKHERQPDKQQDPARNMTSPSVTPVSQTATANKTADTKGEPNPWIEWLRSSGPADWALFVVGGLGVLFGISTLKALKRQTAALEREVAFATSARVYVDGLDVTNFTPGQEPMFFLNIGNAGRVAAENVEVHIEISHTNGRTTPVKPNIIAIPAESVRPYFVRGSFVIPDGPIGLVGWELSITGTVTHKGHQPITVCYKYNPWLANERPPGVPLFVPCDFDQRRHLTLLAGPAAIQIVSDTSAVISHTPNG